MEKAPAPEIVKVQKTVKKQAQPLDMKKVEALMEAGIRLKWVHFKMAVKTRGGLETPENMMYHPGGANRTNRCANLWYTPHGILVEQVGVYKIIPLAACDDTEVL